ncbi:uroporphyrin-III C-methyltransferase [Dyadobacter jejuensis]|uniref:uroporphyrinogen-III C-methyltransferase n=1 Tax=Dyadobacter jejuensis TaxID=1082580 RepID=A0A316AV82_9BACT|nr:uroporphyrinogen-III C-methyltransferase [Dyadobacter jejuensis]PWJ60610.1 uroporphyrin-III C-methyltransferase [Dyadobacter jejuensis]
MTPQLTLIGAGPGSEELITLAGIKALQQADVVLYDELACQGLLQHTPEGSLRMYVGKKAGQARFTQTEINALIVHLARKRGHVVRLKGGDPFVFGRGHEEILYAQQYGIICHTIPGVSSCIAVPEAVGIPVTRRGYSQSFWVITGTTQAGELSEDLHLAAQSQATVVVLMGLNKLKEITAIFQKHGKGNLPVAAIQEGTKPNQKLAIGQVWEIERLVEEKALKAPALLVFGEVVRLQPDYLLRQLQEAALIP